MYDGPELAEATVIGNGDVRHVSYGNDAGLYVEFHTENVYQEAVSEAEGRPVYSQVPYITIYVPGDKTKKVVRPVRTQAFGDTPPDTVRFARQWAAYQQGQQVMATGVPLSEWTQVTASQIREMNSLSIYTVEQLAEVPDAVLPNIGHGGRNLRDQAKAYIARMADDSIVARMVSENADLQRQIDELKASINPHSPVEAPRRGRPPKQTEEIEHAIEE